MTLDEVCQTVYGELRASRYAVVKTLCIPTGQEVFGLLFKQDDEIALTMQKGFAPVVYPHKQNWELVAMETHHPRNNVFQKYNISSEQP